MSDKPVQWIGDKGGEYLESQGIDPRFAHIAARGADLAWGGGVAKGGRKLAKYASRKVAQKAGDYIHPLVAGMGGTGQAWAAAGKSPLVESLPSKYRMTVEGRGLSSTVHQMLDAKEANIAKAQANFDKWDAYVTDKRSQKIKLNSKESVGFSNAKRTLNDVTSTPLKTLVARWFGERGQKGYKVIGDPNVPGGKPPKGSGLDQHHKAGSSEMYHMSKQTAMELDREFRVNTWQYLASKDVLPGWGKANMLDLPSRAHRYELHPHMRSLGFENFWKQIPKDLAKKNPEKFYELIDQWHEEILTPSLQMADEILKKGDVKSIVVTHDKLLLPPQVRKIMEQKQKSILEQAMESYKGDLKIKGAQSLPKSEIKRTFQETQRRI